MPAKQARLACFPQIGTSPLQDISIYFRLKSGLEKSVDGLWGVHGELRIKPPQTIDAFLQTRLKTKIYRNSLQ